MESDRKNFVKRIKEKERKLQKVESNIIDLEEEKIQVVNEA